jgi:hypothetical protein
MKKLKTTQLLLGSVILPNPEFGDMKLNVFPINHSSLNVVLPKQFEQYNDVLNEILAKLPIQEGAIEHFVTIDSKFFAVDDFLRREGVHIDGNFCADPNFKGSTWGGTSTTWGGTKCTPELKITTNWVTEHKFSIPIGTYVSDTLGGIIAVSNQVGCRFWGGEFDGRVGNEGDFSSMEKQLLDPVTMQENELWFMSSNTPHETLLISKNTRRTFLRITLDHRYVNTVISELKKVS